MSSPPSSLHQYVPAGATSCSSTSVLNLCCSTQRCRNSCSFPSLHKQEGDKSSILRSLDAADEAEDEAHAEVDGTTTSPTVAREFRHQSPNPPSDLCHPPPDLPHVTMMTPGLPGRGLSCLGPWGHGESAATFSGLHTAIKYAAHWGFNS